MGHIERVGEPAQHRLFVHPRKGEVLELSLAISTLLVAHCHCVVANICTCPKCSPFPPHLHLMGRAEVHLRLPILYLQILPVNSVPERSRTPTKSLILRVLLDGEGRDQGLKICIGRHVAVDISSLYHGLALHVLKAK